MRRKSVKTGWFFFMVCAVISKDLERGWMSKVLKGSFHIFLKVALSWFLVFLVHRFELYPHKLVSFKNTPKVRFFLSNFWGAVQFNFFLFWDHFPEKINDIGQSVGIDDESDRLAEKDNQHVLFESHLGQGRQHAEKVGWTDGPNHHENKEAVKTIALI